MRYLKNINETTVLGKAGTIELIQNIDGHYILEFKDIGNISLGKNKDTAMYILDSVMKLKSINRTDQKIFEMISENIRFFTVWLDL
jgi:hypothetical protein